MGYKWPLVIFTKFSNAGSENRNDVGAGERVCEFLCTLALEGRNFLDDLLCHGNSRAARRWTHSECTLMYTTIKLASRWACCNPTKLISVVQNATVPMTRDFYHLLPVVAACLLCPFFIANETREMTFTKVKDSRSCLTQWDYEYLYEFSIHRCTFLWLQQHPDPKRARSEEF